MSLPFYRVFSNDEAQTMALMTAEERGAYHYLRNLSWTQMPPATLPDDDQVLARAAAVPLKRWRTMKPVALKGWISDGSRLIHPEFQEEYARSEKVSKRATKKNMDRWHGKENTSCRTPVGLLLESSLSPSLSEPEIKRGVDSPNRSGSDVPAQVFNNADQEKMPMREKMKSPSLNGFPWPWPDGLAYTSENLFTHVFYPAYPLKKKKHRALAVFQTLQPSVPYLMQIMAYLEKEKIYWEATGQTAPLPDNFLKAQEWKYDEHPSPEIKPVGIVVSDAVEPEPNKALIGNGTFLNKAGTYPRD